jgi:hypothetical protein
VTSQGKSARPGGRINGGGSLWSAPGPAREPLPEHGDVRWVQAVAGERAVGHLVEAVACLGEVLVFKSRVQIPGQADQLGDVVALAERGRGVDVIELGCPASQRDDLAGDDVRDRAPVLCPW